jgi:GR25 family glycosyltransferase involved in LPS biosynthesis
MKVSFSVMAHVDRQDHLHYYRKILGDIPVAMDNGDYGLIFNCLRAWRLYDLKADYHCVLQDDLLLTTNFLRKLQHHLSKGHPVYHLYLGNRSRFKPYVAKALKHNIDHVLLNNVHSAQAIVMRTELIQPMLEHYKTSNEPLDDMRINNFIRKNKLKVYFPLPNLVEHLNPKSLHNLNKSALNTRVSICFEL